MPPPPAPIPDATHAERQALLEQISDLLEKPLLVLSLVWLILVILDLVGYSPRALEILSYVIWGIFVADFALEFTIAPRKGAFLRHNWLSALALAAPALRLLRIARLFRVLRAARAARGLRLLRVVSTANRGIRTARTILARRGIAYVLLLNAVVLLVGSGGMFAFERPPDGQLGSYGEALWWTAMLLTTLGSEYWPRTVEGRILAWLLALFAFSVFGYVTATLASFFIHQDKEVPPPDAAEPDDPAERAERDALRTEVAALRAEIRALREEIARPRPGP